LAGHLRKRGDKWYYSFEVGSVNGKRKRIERVGGRTKKEAESALRKAIDQNTKMQEITFNPAKYQWPTTWTTGMKTMY